MITSSGSLLEFFDAHRARSEPLVLATIVRTIGSTYRKAGAHMLIAQDGQAAGLLSGGCAESDLIERARRVFSSGQAELADYDTRGSDDVIWGIGLGCEGAMRILLTLLDTKNDYQPFTMIAQHIREHRRGAFAFVVAPHGKENVLGQSWHSQIEALPAALQLLMESAATVRAAETARFENNEVFVAPIDLPPRLLVLGAGADAMPVAEIAGLMGWQVSLVDHRPAYAVASRFARAREVLLVPAKELTQRIKIADFDAAVVMSHHLPTDQMYLEALANSSIGYVGLLGPAARRARLLSELGELAVSLHGRLAGPVGLDIGAKSPETIALAIVAEIHAHLYGHSGGSYSELLKRSG
ncbi:MAG: XdhC family protein [Candidatus Obscuribacterales bacterium]|nr:XdhC family protein [Steroidobacteraceae bacterium]